MFVTIKEGKNNNINNLLASSHTHVKAFFVEQLEKERQRERQMERENNIMKFIKNK